MELSRADGVAGVLALTRVEVRVRFVVILHADQEESGCCREQSEAPQRKDDVLNPPSGHHYFAPQGEADGQVALDAQSRDVEDGGRGAAFEDVVVEAAHGLPEQPGHVLPQAVQVKGQAQEDNEVGHCHAGQVQVGCGLHVFEVLNDEDSQGVARHPNDEDKDADGGDGDEGGSREEGPLVVVVFIYVVWVHGHCSTCMKVQLRSGPGHTTLTDFWFRMLSGSLASKIYQEKFRFYLKKKPAHRFI